MLFHLTPKSSNKKTGPIPVSTSPESTCPNSCPLKGKGCYADGGPLRIHWDKVSNGERGFNWQQFLNAIRSLPEGQLWRHNQCGDLVGIGQKVISDRQLQELVAANKGKKGFTYTHYPIDEHNSDCIAFANGNGFTINWSSDSLEEADKKYDEECGPVTTLLPSDCNHKVYTPKHRLVIPCPVALDKLESCAVCGLCQKANRQAIIGFPAHGSKKKHVDRLLSVIEEHYETS